jgi:hypothetical protein
MKAWLVTWEWDGDHAKVKEPIAAVLRARRSSKQVREIVELIYVNETYSFSERLAYATNKGTNPYPATWGYLGKRQWEGEIYCGPNPYLYARLVDDLQVQVNRAGKEKLTWNERLKPEPKWTQKPEDV